MPDRLAEIRARLDAATPGPWTAEGDELVWDDNGLEVIHVVVNAENTDLIAHAPADIAWLLERESQMMGALAVMTDLAAYDGGAIGRKSLDECLRDFGLTLDEVEARDER